MLAPSFLSNRQIVPFILSACGIKYYNFGAIIKNVHDRIGTCTCGNRQSTLGFLWTSSRHYIELSEEAIQNEIKNREYLEDYEFCIVLNKVLEKELK